MAKVRAAVVAVQSNLVGQKVRPVAPYDEVGGDTWPFSAVVDRVGRHTAVEAEVVAVYVGDLQEGGALRFLLMAPDGRVRECYAHAFKVVPGWIDERDSEGG